MIYTLWQFIFFFFLYSFLGWVAEVVYAALQTGRVVNRGFLNGPVCPIYGFGMAAILLLLEGWADNVLVVFAGGMCITTTVELIGGWLLYRLFAARWWDYSDQPFNLGGFICLKFALLWGIGCVILVMILHPLFAMPVLHAGQTPLMLLDILFAVTLAADTGLSAAVAVGLNRKLAQIDEARAAMRGVSDRLSTVIGSNTLTADEILDEKKLQLALAKLEGRENAEQLAADFYRLRSEAVLRYHTAVNELQKHSHFGANRLLRAFPTMRSRDHAEAVVVLHRAIFSRMAWVKSAVREAVHEAAESISEEDLWPHS